LTRTQNNEADTRHGKELPLQNERFAVRKYLGELQQFSPLVPPIPLAALRSLHVAQDYKGMVRLIKQVMNVEVSLRIAWVPEGAAETGATKGAPAWISVPKEMPAYGTKAFKDMRLDLYLRRSFLQRSSHDQIAIAIAHELSHIVLDSIHHPLRGCEKAVDLTAMLLRFRAIIFCASSGVCAQGRHGRLPSTSKVFSLARTCPTSKQKRRPQSRPPPPHSRTA
jgi:hypothetical protein